ncbi:MAG TPA: MFS transporter [Bacilli bacterium]|nr:MFS transporter [Bacilli bacterium]
MNTFSKIKPLPPRVWVVILGLWAISLGSFMIIPFFSIFLAQEIGMSTVQIGMALTAKLWAQQGMTFLGGLCSDRYGTKATMFGGLMIRGFSYVGIAYSHSAFWVILWSIFMGLGSALYTPAGKAALVQLSAGVERTLVFSIRSTFTNLGVSLGPLLGALAIFSNPQYVFMIVAVIYFVFALLTVGFVPKLRVQQEKQVTNWHLVRDIFRTRGVWYLILANICFMVLYTQMELTLPLFTQMRFSEWGVSLLFTVNAIAVIFFQIPLSAWLSRKHSLSFAMFFGLGTMATGLILFGYSPYLFVLLFAVALFSLGEVTIEPRIDAELTQLVPENSIGTAFGLIGVASSIGGAVGNTVGGMMYSFFSAQGYANWFWYVTGMAALVVSFCLLLGKRKSEYMGKDLSV